MTKADLILKIKNRLSDKLRELPSCLIDFKVDEEYLLSASGGLMLVFHFKIEQYRYGRTHSMIKYDLLSKIEKILESRLHELPSTIGDFIFTDDYDNFRETITTDVEIRIYQSKNVQKEPDFQQDFKISFDDGKWNVAVTGPYTFESCSTARIMRIVREALDEEFPEGPSAYEDNLTLDFD